MQTAAVGKGFKCMGIGINKTIYEIYLDILKNHLTPIQDGMILRMCERNMITLLRLRPLRSVWDHILLPEGREIWHLDVNKSRAQYQKILYDSSNKTPTCGICGANTEFGYKNCSYHLKPCCRCKRKEVDIGIDGNEYCYDCSRHAYEKK